MATHAKKSKKAEYDPARQWGLKPELESSSSGGGATYFVEGHVVAGSNDAKSLFLSETIGRDAQARASRKASGVEADRALQVLLKRDREGTRALASAREFARRQAGKEKAEKGGEGKKVDKKGKGKGRPDAVSGEESGSEREEEEDMKKPHRHSYSASLIKQLGFDPTSKDGRRSADPKLQNKVGSLLVPYVGPYARGADDVSNDSSTPSLLCRRRRETSTSRRGRGRSGVVLVNRRGRWGSLQR